ncbi:unnamed protein product [Rotaria sordida]|uniref:Ubiquitin-like domain-containing protein n=1 Tax=Rotaria sordida TaxID=392033 RepID=A0A814UV86_9BILA|nr:unnamed protein product [Rotaria sordida]CAF1438345.1 unnamed protein product [Rotaria sordida]
MLYWQIQRDFLALFSRDDVTNGYFDPIDGLRAIANLLIIFCHLVTIFSAFIPSYPHIQWQEFLNSQAFMLAPIMTLALEIFFMLSAFLLTHKLIIQWMKDDNSHRLFLQQYPKLILKRALRFWPGILLATIIMFICGESRHINPVTHLVSVWLFFQNYVDYDHWLTTLSPLWTISLDMQAYILLPLLLYLFYSCRIQFQTKITKDKLNEDLFSINIDGIDHELKNQYKPIPLDVYKSTIVHELKAIFESMYKFPKSNQCFFVNGSFAHEDLLMNDLNVKNNSLFVLFLTKQNEYKIVRV